VAVGDLLALQVVNGGIRISNLALPVLPISRLRREKTSIIKKISRGDIRQLSVTRCGRPIRPDDLVIRGMNFLNTLHGNVNSQEI
jgi:hypothetical protein